MKFQVKMPFHHVYDTYIASWACHASIALLWFRTLVGKLLRQFFIDRLAMADSDETNHARLAMDLVDDPEPPDSKLPQAVEFTA